MEWFKLHQEIETSDFLSAHFQREFLEPLQEFMSRGCKKIRSQLVQLGASFGAEEKVQADSSAAFCRAIELLHTGTLILDDIQDASPTRRGRPSLHIQMGFARALNLGSWLLIASQKVIESSVQDSQQRLKILELVRDTLYWGHIGQSIDLGVNMREVARSSVGEIVEQSHRFKTASVTGLAVAGGAVLANSHDAQKAFALGEKIGMILQKFDDIKNLRMDSMAPDKRFEDLRNSRPSYIWEWASRSTLTHESLRTAAGHLPLEQPLFDWLENHDFFSSAFRELNDSMKFIEDQAQTREQRELVHSLFAQLRTAVERTTL